MADITNEIMTNNKTKILSGEFLNFYTPRRQRIRSFKVYFSPKQEGSGTPSPDNVRPISGWTGVEVNHCGKNLIDEDFLRNGDNYHIAGAYNYWYTDWIYLVPNTQYKFTWSDFDNDKILDKGCNLYVANAAQYIINNGKYHQYSSSFTTNSEGAIRFGIYRPSSSPYTDKQELLDAIFDNGHLQLELGTQATDYTPYKTNLSLPKEYQQVEYLESTGTQYIATNYAPKNSPNAEWKCLELATDGENGLFGRNSSSINRYFYDTYYGGVYIYRHKKVIRGNYRFVADFTKKPYEAIFTDNTLEIKNYGTQTLNGNTNYSDTSGLPFYIFAINSGGTSWLPHHGARLYYLRFYENDTLSANFIPCYRKSDKVAGMYDAVSGQFYTNSGTGEFITGPAVNRYDIDWSEDVGTVYGGYVDLVSGELSETWKLVSYDGTTDAIRGQTSYQRFSLCADNDGNLLYERANPSHIVCDKLLNTGANGMGNPTYRIAVLSAYQIQVKITEDVNTPELLLEWLNENPIQVAVELATPITHHLSPTTLSTLMWDNNFWSNTDRVEIEYDYIGIFDAIESRKNIFTATPHTATVKDSIISFGTDMAADLKECKVYFKPKQLGEGTPSPENVRPIEGWDRITVTKWGKNLLPDVSSTNFWTTGWLNTSGGITPSNNPYITSDFMRVKSGDNYILQLYNDYDGGISNAWKCIGFYDKNKSFLTGQYYEKGIYSALTVSVPADANYMRVSFTNQNRKGFPDFHFQLEFGTEVTDYEPYQPPTEITISFPQTIYGGYVDLVNGEIVEEWKEYVYPNKTNVFNDWGNGYYEVGFGDVYGKGYGSANNSMCSKLSYEYKTSTLEIGYTLDYVLNYQSNRFHTLVHSETPLTADTARQWFIDNNIQLVREVYSPTSYPISPQILATLRGANTIWSNTNSDVEITYWKHNDDSYQHVSSSPITSNDNFIIVTDDGYAIGEEDDFIVY